MDVFGAQSLQKHLEPSERSNGPLFELHWVQCVADMSDFVTVTLQKIWTQMIAILNEKCTFV